ncbi:LptF/LptG family permease [Moheibacter lacus]|uniref:LptF/LptG family permease n=1 Tax=Moheibacter lacus TaxID=2745851 RepID=A0A838ZS64_9FLAO|nr:LptF/LptG family permease [Moheibacter lacus]MBA5628979.1 LptF/LptG family permease [Moheibacter lacus]
MKIFDKYIVKNFVSTFFFMVIILSTIAVIIDLSQKLGRIEDNGSTPMAALIHFYPYWAVWLVNTFLPVAVFISVIYFTSRLTMQTEIVAAQAGGISFFRITKPYIWVAAAIAIVALFVNNFALPWANIKKNTYQYEYLLSNTKKGEYYERQKISSQISPNEYIFAQNYDRVQKRGTSFVFQEFDKEEKLKYQIIASSFNWDEKDSVYILRSAFIKKVKSDFRDSLGYQITLKRKFKATPDEILPEGYVAETMNSLELNDFIQKQKFKGSASVNAYMNELHQRNSSPFSTFILTLLALSLSSQKRRGGIGLNLALGIILAFVYIFFNQISLTYSTQGYVSPFVAAWGPNFLFGILTAYFYMKRARA